MKTNIRRVLLLRPGSLLLRSVKHPRGPRYPYVLKYMEALLKRRSLFDVKLMDLAVHSMTLDEAQPSILDWSPDLIVIFSTTRDLPDVLRFSSVIKNFSSAVIISVGQDATARPEKYVFAGSPVDIVLCGDAELELLKVIDRLDSGDSLQSIREFYFQNRILITTGLDDLPFPEVSFDEMQAYRHIYPIPLGRRLTWGHIITSRGCPYPCMFCTEMIRETTGDSQRFRSAKNIVDEMAYLAAQGANIIIFDDDNLTTSPAHVKNICEEINRRKLRLPWVAHARIDNLTDELLQAMHKAGCILLRFGVESGSSRIVKLLEKTSRIDWNEQAKKVFRACRRYGINTLSLFIIGSPTETAAEVEESIQLAEELDPDVLQVSFFTLYPDTKALARLKGVADNYDFSGLYHFSTSAPALNLSAMDNETLERMQSVFYKRILLRPRYLIRHLLKYGLFYLYNPETWRSLASVGRYFAKGRTVLPELKLREPITQRAGGIL